MPISYKYKCIFVHIPKTAGTSIEAALGMHGDLTKVGIEPYYKQKRDIKNFFGKGLQHFTAEQLRAHPVAGKLFKNYFKFAFVRNPWDRLVSELAWRGAGKSVDTTRLYFEKKLSKVEEEWGSKKGLSRIHVMPQINFIIDKRTREKIVDFVGRFESLQKDWDVLLSKIGTEKIILPHRMKSIHIPYWEYYTPRTKDLVYEIYRKDIEYFNYKFGV